MATIVKREGRDGPRYYVVYRYGGKQRWELAGRREVDARRLKARIEKQLYEGTFRMVDDKTFDDLSEEFLRLKRREVRPNTFTAYESAARRLLRHLSGRKLKDIGVREVEELSSAFLSEGISTATAFRCLSLLSSMFKKAVLWGYIPYNPAEYVKKPRVERPEPDFLEPEEIRRLIEATEERHRALIMFACLTGARQSEILGLRWGDLDLEEGRAYIRQVLQGGKFYPPKSRAGRRVIDLPPVLVEELKVHRLRQAVELEENPHDLVFTTSLGTPMDKRNVTQRILEPALRKAGLRKVGFHALRHSYISMLIAQGESIKTVQALAGHSSVRMTVDVYGHLFERAGKAAAERLEKAIYGKMEKSASNTSSNTS